MTICEHVDDRMRYQVLPARPRGATAVRCPCCGLGGWMHDDDPDPMVCPYCAVAAVVDAAEVSS